MLEHLSTCIDVPVLRDLQMQSLWLLLGAHFLLTLSLSSEKLHVLSKEAYVRNADC